MKHISEIIQDILVEWAYRVHDGMPNPKNAQHIHKLRESMEELNLPNKVIYKVIQNLIKEKDIVKNKESGNTYVVAKHNPNTQDLIKKDATSIASAIEKKIGKHTGGPVWWAGPSNDSTDYGASDMVIKTDKHGWVGVSLKAGKGQLKNLTINTFFKALGIPFGDGQDAKAADHFLKNYSKHWDAMTKDWVTLVEKEFKKKTKDKKALSVFRKHKKLKWNDFQKETMKQEEIDILTDAVGMKKLDKTTTFKYFCHKMNNYFYPRKNYPGWNKKRDGHFDNIFRDFGNQYEGEIQSGLSDLFARQMSVGKKNMFYAASAGKTIWFIPSEETFNKFFSADDFIAQFSTKASGSGYEFQLDVGHQDEGAVGSIIVTFRFKQGQMTKFPDTTSDYKLYAADWSKLLGTFEK